MAEVYQISRDERLPSAQHKDKEVLLAADLLAPAEEEPQERPDFERINEAFEYARELRDATKVVLRAKMCRAFYESKQYMRWDAELEDVIEDDTLKKLGLWDNIIRPNVDLITAKASMSPKRLEVIPGSNRQAAAEVAKVATGYLEWMMHRLDWDGIEDQVNRILQIDGTHYIRLSWNADAIDYVPFVVMDRDAPPTELPDEEFQFQERVPYKNLWLDIIRGPFGAPKLDLLSIEQVYPPPNVEDIKDARCFWVVEDNVSIAEIQEDYPDAEFEVEPHGTETGVQTEGGAVLDESEMVGGTSFSTKAATARIYHYFEADGSQWRKISYLSEQRSDDRYVWLNPNEPPHENHGVIQVKFNRLPGRYYSNGTVWDMIPMQLGKNMSFVSLIANTELSSKPVLTSRGNAVFTPGVFCHTVEIPDEADAAEIIWSTIPSTAAQSIAVMDKMQEMGDRKAIVHDVSQGRNLPKQMSGKALEALIAQQDVAPNRLAAETQGAGIEIAKMLLQMARTHFVESRLLPVTDRNHEMKLLTSGSLPAMSTIVPEFSRYIPRDQVGMMETLGMLAKIGWFDPGNEERTRRMARFLEMRSSETSELLPTLQRIRNLIERDIEEIETGQTFVNQGQVYSVNEEPMVQPWHDHASWLLEAQSFMLGDRYRDEWRDYPENRAIFQTLVQAHQQAIAADNRPPDAAIVTALAQMLPNVKPESAAKTWEQIKATAAQAMLAANMPQQAPTGAPIPRPGGQQ